MTDDAGDISEKTYRYPIVECCLWLKDWAGLSFCAAIIWQFSMTGTVRIVDDPLSTVLSTLWFLALVLTCLPLWFVVEIWWSLRQHVFNNYDRSFARNIIFAGSAVVIIVTTLYVFAQHWILIALSRTLDAIHSPSKLPAKPLHVADPILSGILTLLTAVALYIAARTVVVSLRRYRAAIGLLSLQKVMRGVLMMALIRLRYPRRDFMRQAPLISILPQLMVVILIYWFIPFIIFDSIAATLIFFFCVVMAIDNLCPPVWLFLGTSRFDSIDTFHRLRMAWGKEHFGVAMLDRESREGVEHYYAFRDAMVARGNHVYRFMNQPSAVRTWNLRTNPDVWQHTVRLLMDYVSAIVIDVRESSAAVQLELEWLSVPARSTKTWFIGDETSDAQAVNIHPAAVERLVTEDLLVCARWSASGFQLTGVAS